MVGEVLGVGQGGWSVVCTSVCGYQTTFWMMVVVCEV